MGLGTIPKHREDSLKILVGKVVLRAMTNSTSQ
jgi:hypothetical protein